METLTPLSSDGRLPETAVEPLERLERPAVFALVAITAIHLAIFAYVAVAGLVRQPYSDMFDFLKAEFAFEKTGDLAAYLAAEHNHQHLVWVRVLTAIDVQAFHGTGVIFALAAGLSMLMGAIVIGRELWRSASRRIVGAAAAAITVLLLMSTVNAINVTQPINSVYAIASGFAALAIVLFERAESAPGRTILYAVLALLAGLSAAAGSAAGVAVFPVLMVSAVRNPVNRSLLAPALIVGLAAMGVVGGALMSGGNSTAGGPHLAKMADYFLSYAGMPWSAIRGVSRVRVAIGLVATSLSAVLLWRGSRRDGGAGRLERIGLDLILFALGTAIMAALGRVDESDQVIVPVRYAIFMSALQVGVICVLTPALTAHWERAQRWAVPAALIAALVLLAQQAAASVFALRTSDEIRAAIAAFDAGVRRPEMRQLIHPDFVVAEQVNAACRRRGLYQ